ncbi:quinol dehydrogenase ferredoxin subunit NapH [Hahella sp. SMD15-11]|uniref:Quinol dehydrogenase ferredoxin subunit NapH n=1 Tax=Thermohahella caldifontis TaxID=3142973 RepID=A0AB39UXC4_9GAMM
MNPGVSHEAVVQKGWWRAQRWLLMRRIMQLSVLAGFASGPWLGIWILKGNLSTSLLLNTVPLSDPLTLIQSMLAGHVPATMALVGGAIVLGVYLLLGGRLFCGWVCPVNLVTDAAEWTRHRFNLPTRPGNPKGRYAILGGVLVGAAVTGTLVWEWINPITLAIRVITLGAVGGLWVLAGIFLYDLFIRRNGWCGTLCPVGSFYALVNRFGWLKIRLPARDKCDDCMACFKACPEPQVIKIPLKQLDAEPVIRDPACTLCGRCVDVCPENVFQFGSRKASDQLQTVEIKP